MEYKKVMLEVKENVVVDDGSKCVCGECEIEEHTCPFSEEIHNDCESLCQCCAYCTQQCAWDI